MSRRNSPVVWLLAAGGIAIAVWGMFAAPAESFSQKRSEKRPAKGDGHPPSSGRAEAAPERTGVSPPFRAAEGGTSKTPNLSLWVPEEELRVWDPVNPNVNPVPWRVFGPLPDEGKRTAAFRHTAIDRRVRVEGLAWGYDGKTELPTSRVVFEGGTVLVEGVDFHRPDVRGKTVRVDGVLRLATMPHRGFERQFPNYYFLEAESFEVIERVTDPHVVFVP